MKKFLSVVLSLALLCFLFIPTTALDKASEVTFDTALYYPIVGTEKWADMERYERVDACQISDESLSKMSTGELLQTVLEYPFMIDLYAFDTYATGFKHVYSEFSALYELAGREDIGTVLINFYKDTPVLKKAENSLDYKNIRNLSIIEILIAQPEMTHNLEETEITSLISIAKAKYLEKSATMSVNSGNLTTFYEAIEDHPNSMIARAVQADTTVYTPNGSPVTVQDRSGIIDWSVPEVIALNTHYDAAYPATTRLRNPTKKYNCHSYAWYDTSTSNRYWMAYPKPYMTDFSYTSTTSPSIGNRVYWEDSGPIPMPVHSGIYASHMQGKPVISCTSKWGELGLYNHGISDCPYSGTISYWK